MVTKRITDDEKQLIRKLAFAGVSQKEIGAIIGKTQQAIAAYLGRNHISVKRVANVKKKTRQGNYGKHSATLCWSCANACHGCSWSRDFKPIPGRDAEPTEIKCKADGKVVITKSYHVKKCPLYKSDRRKGVNCNYV